MKKQLMVLGLFWAFSSVNSQSLVSASGGIYQDDNLQVSWTLGEQRTSQINNTDFLVSEGQQQESINVISLIKELEPYVKVEVFPNPTSDVIRLSNNSSEPLEYIIMNPKGIIIVKNSLKTTETADLNDYENGVYFIHVKNAKTNQSSSFNIIKK